MPDIKLFLVIIVFPLIVNIFYFWISDNILKKKKFTKLEERQLTSFYEEGNNLQDCQNRYYQDL